MVFGRALCRLLDRFFPVGSVIATPPRYQCGFTAQEALDFGRADTTLPLVPVKPPITGTLF